MSIALFRDSLNNIYNENSNIDLCIPISSERFYLKYWEKAIEQLNIKFIKDGSQFKKENLTEVMFELELLEEWTKTNLKLEDLKYMLTRINNLKEEIPRAFINENTILYIF